MPEPVSSAVAASHWVLPAAKELYDHRKEIAGLWERLSNRLFGRKSQIAITGAAGVGKTVLFDHLCGIAPAIGYTPPGRSEDKERRRARMVKGRVALTTVPGQPSQPRMVTLEELFGGDGIVEGVIHVVSNGYVEERVKETADILDEHGILTLDGFRRAHLRQELEDLDDVLGYIERAHNRPKAKGSPSWMLAAVAKYDLYYDEAAQAADYYWNDGASPFVQKMKQFTGRVGQYKFRWEALPVSTYLDVFRWPRGVVRPQLAEPERDHFLGAFARSLEKHCGH